MTMLMIFIPLLQRISMLDNLIDDFWYDNTFRKIVMARLDSIAYGLLAAWISYYYEKYWIKLKMPAFFTGILMIIFIVNYASPNTSFYKQVIYFSITPISAMLLLPFAASIKKTKGILVRIFAHISKISYSMYLINLALVAEVIKFNFSPANETDAILKYVLYWSVVIVVSSVMYQYYEKPAMNLRDKKFDFRKMVSEVRIKIKN